MKVNFLLPMKGHSERVPNKNLRKFVEFPLYHYILKQIFLSKYINGIFINTDSQQIIDDVKTHFPIVNIIERPEDLIGDDISMNRIIEYDLNKIDGEFFFQTHSTNPLLKAETIDKAIEFYFLNNEKFDSVYSVTKRQTRFYWADGKPVNHNPKELIKTQDLPPIFEENSNFYIFSKNSFHNGNNVRIGKRPFMFEVNPFEAIDIDTEFDFMLASQIFRTVNKL